MQRALFMFARMPLTRKSLLVKSFEKYAIDLLDTCNSFTDITRFAGQLTKKANELLEEAKLDRIVDLPVLQKELFELGTDYIKQFTVRYKSGYGRK